MMVMMQPRSRAGSWGGTCPSRPSAGHGGMADGPWWVVVVGGCQALAAQLKALEGRLEEGGQGQGGGGGGANKQ
jgi:hypothetical protein